MQFLSPNSHRFKRDAMSQGILQPNYIVYSIPSLRIAGAKPRLIRGLLPSACFSSSCRAETETAFPQFHGSTLGPIVVVESQVRNLVHKSLYDPCPLTFSLPFPPPPSLHTHPPRGTLPPKKEEVEKQTTGHRPQAWNVFLLPYCLGAPGCKLSIRLCCRTTQIQVP